MDPRCEDTLPDGMCRGVDLTVEPWQSPEADPIGHYLFYGRKPR